MMSIPRMTASGHKFNLPMLRFQASENFCFSPEVTPRLKQGIHISRVVGGNALKADILVVRPT